MRVYKNYKNQIFYDIYIKYNCALQRNIKKIKQNVSIDVKLLYCMETF